jgi:hypothetical protein
MSLQHFSNDSFKVCLPSFFLNHMRTTTTYISFPAGSWHPTQLLAHRKYTLNS